MIAIYPRATPHARSIVCHQVLRQKTGTGSIWGFQLDVERKRKINGVTLPEVQIDRRVTERRNLHVSGLKLAQKLSSSLRVSSLVVGIVFVFLPGILPSWRHVISSNWLTGTFYSQMTTIGPLARYVLYGLTLLFLLRASVDKYVPWSTSLSKTNSDILEMELFPRTRREGKRVFITPGMSLSVEIKTGVRRLISYVLSPLQTQITESGRER